jgi:hypothetical protein
VLDELDLLSLIYEPLAEAETNRQEDVVPRQAHEVHERLPVQPDLEGFLARYDVINGVGLSVVIADDPVGSERQLFLLGGFLDRHVASRASTSSILSIRSSGLKGLVMYP